MEENKEKEKHWIERLADTIADSKEGPYSLTSGVTTSGPVHWGTICEFLYQYTITNELKDRGCEARAYFVADVLDAFDKINSELIFYENVMRPELGKPLIYTLDPIGCHSSLA
ncbi:lysyl-tRNA synthetase, partial [mine drainage metagenome]